MDLVLVCCVVQGTRNEHGPLFALLEGEAEWKSALCTQVQFVTPEALHMKCLTILVGTKQVSHGMIQFFSANDAYGACTMHFCNLQITLQ